MTGDWGEAAPGSFAIGTGNGQVFACRAVLDSLTG
jgi:hypothetical protein